MMSFSVAPEVGVSLLLSLVSISSSTFDSTVLHVHILCQAGTKILFVHVNYDPVILVRLFG